jgi:predicted DNA-binding WGR domain protein
MPSAKIEFHPEDTVPLLESPRLEYTEGTSAKFYQAVVGHDSGQGAFVGYVRWGRLGTDGKLSCFYVGPSAERALGAVWVKHREKERKGYRPVEPRGNWADHWAWDRDPPGRLVTELREAARRDGLRERGDVRAGGRPSAPVNQYKPVDDDAPI